MAKCEGAGMRINTSKSEAMVLSGKSAGCPFRVGNESLPQVKEFKYLGALIMCEGRLAEELKPQEPFYTPFTAPLWRKES